MGHVVHRRNACDSQYCPACGHYKDHDHILVCNHPSHHLLKQELVTSLWSCLDRNRFDPILCDILLEGILSLLHSHPFAFHLFLVPYHSLCISQCNLGWAHLLKGFVSVHWQILQNSYFESSGDFQMIDKPGLLSVIHHVLDSVIAIWTFRNNQHHNADNAIHESKTTCQTIEAISELYELRDDVLPLDRCLFHLSLDVHLTESQSSLHAWLSNHSTQLRRSHHAAQGLNVSNTNPLESYFS